MPVNNFQNRKGKNILPEPETGVGRRKGQLFRKIGEKIKGGEDERNREIAIAGAFGS